MKEKSIKMRLLIALFTVLVFAGMIFSILRFYRILQEDEYELQKDSLLDMAKLETSLMEVRLQGYIDTLHAIAEFLHQGELYTSGHMEHLQEISEAGSLHRLGIITLDGVLHSPLGETNISNRDYYQGILRGEPFVTGILTSVFTGERVVTMAVPAYDDSGQLRGAIHAAVLLDEFEPYTNTRLSVGNSTTYVFDRDGEYIIKNNQEGASWNYSNIFEHLEQAADGMPIGELRLAIREGRSVTTEVVSGDVTYLGCFLPIRNGEWYTLVATPVADIHARVSGLMDRDFYGMLAAIVFLAGALCIAILVWIHRQGIWMQKREIELRERLMAKVVGFMVVDLDEECILSRSGRGILRENLEMKSYPEYIRNIVEAGGHPDFKKTLFKFFSAEEIRADAASGLPDRKLEFLFRYMGGEESVWLECESHIDRDNKTGHLIISHILRDIHSRKEEELTLRSEAERDMLSGLYNRSTGVRMIERSLSVSDNTENHALVLLDLDNFKTLNDTLGHQYGDQAIRDTANTITSHFRKDDIVCRLGGDEFVIYLKNISPALVREKLGALLERLHLPYEDNGRTVWINASAGIVFAASGDTFEELYHHADQALYQAKRSGKAKFCEYQ